MYQGVCVWEVLDEEAWLEAPYADLPLNERVCLHVNMSGGK